MELSLWTYEGPPHVGAIRVATSMQGVHLLLHAPQGDTYADLLFTMIERNAARPPVTYTTFQARDLGGDTSNLVIRAAAETCERYKPQVLLVGDSCTAELLQDQPGTLAAGSGLPVPVISLDLHAYSHKENWGASETLYKLVRGLLGKRAATFDPETKTTAAPDQPSVNLIGPSALGFRCRDDIIEIRRLLEQAGVAVNVVAPAGASAADILRIPDAQANICLYPEIADTTCDWLKRAFKQPVIRSVPIGVGATNDFLDEVGEVLGLDCRSAKAESMCHMPWYSKSVDSTYLTAKRVFIFADGSHAVAAARIAREELGFDVVGLGTYSREQARTVRRVAKELNIEPLITDDYLEVEREVARLQPELVLGTQMERHIAKRLGIGCAVISTPAHVQDYPARYSPQMGYEGANVIFDSWVHPLMMGLEEHLLTMFRDDFEFSEAVTASHLASSGEHTVPVQELPVASIDGEPMWDKDAEQELKKIPFFVRGKARRNTERFATERGMSLINLETLYEAKAHFSS
ncbi:MAG: ferredoxin:protochlorophyllide reductase (ATP-dependent) subunit B [Pseudomonadota bacterium]